MVYSDEIMALELTQEELYDLGFTLKDEDFENRRYKQVGFSATKYVGNEFAFFYYCDINVDDHGLAGRNHVFDIRVNNTTGMESVISNIETLERFHELENVLNKK